MIPPVVNTSKEHLIHSSSSVSQEKLNESNNEDTNVKKNQPNFTRSKGRKWSIADIDIGRKLGEGRFGSVYLAREKSSRFVIALKILMKSTLISKEHMKQLQREIEIQFHLKHPNIVRLYSYFYDTKRIYLMLEYVPKGELSEEIDRFGSFNCRRSATYVYQLSQALAYCHQNDVIHRDIKPQNILVGAKGEVKIADFGCAVHTPASRRTTTIGTLNYLAPEVFHSESVHDHRVDIWSLGILTFEMLSGYLPFDGDTEKQIAESIQSNKAAFPSFMDAGAVELITNMLQKSPCDRISLVNICNHYWISANAELTLMQCKAACEDWERISTNNSHNLNSASTINNESSDVSTNKCDL